MRVKLGLKSIKSSCILTRFAELTSSVLYIDDAHHPPNPATADLGRITIIMLCKRAPNNEPAKNIYTCNHQEAVRNAATQHMRAIPQLRHVCSTCTSRHAGTHTLMRGSQSFYQHIRTVHRELSCLETLT